MRKIYLIKGGFVGRDYISARAAAKAYMAAGLMLVGPGMCRFCEILVQGTNMLGIDDEYITPLYPQDNIDDYINVVNKIELERQELIENERVFNEYVKTSSGRVLLAQAYNAYRNIKSKMKGRGNDTR